MQRIAGIAWFLMLVLLVIGCSDGGHTSFQPQLTGNIIQGHINSPDPQAMGQERLAVAGAVVMVQETGFTGRTDTSGFYQVAVPETGSYTLVVSHPLYRDPAVVPINVTGEVTEQDATLGIGYYVLVGVNDYLYINDLRGPENDVDGLTATLPMFSGRLTVLKSAQATKANIRKAFTDAAQRMQPNDFFIFYFSGHGGRDLTADYICPTDTVLVNYEHDIMDSELRAWLQEMPNTSRTVVMMDTCFSGSFIDGYESPRTKASTVIETPTFRALSKTSCTVLAASAKDEYSWEDIDNLGVMHGFFSRNLVNGLSIARNIADVNKDRLITARELFDYASARTIADTQHLVSQTPQFQEGSNPVIARY